MLNTKNHLDLEASYAMMQQDNEIIFGGKNRAGI